MTWYDDSNHPFAGIAQKLKRANENILNLQREIDGFFEGCQYPVMPDVNSETWRDAVDYHKNLIIPLYASVLCGEIVHHMRSCFDHIAWHLSSADYRSAYKNAIEFPVLREEPVTKSELSRYKRKREGIKNTNVISLIEGMQPHKRAGNIEDDPLLIVHDMDRFDKHRELAIVSTCANLAFPPSTSVDALLAIIKHSQGEPLTDAGRRLSHVAINQDAKVFPQVAFAKFGQRKYQPVIPSLIQLLQAVVARVDLFAREV